jgi:hypothetical protein
MPLKNTSQEADHNILLHTNHSHKQRQQPLSVTILGLLGSSLHGSYLSSGVFGLEPHAIRANSPRFDFCLGAELPTGS